MAVLAGALALAAGTPLRMLPQALTVGRAFTVLKKFAPGVQWQSGSAVHGNFEGTAPDDVAVLGATPGFTYVGLVSAATGRVATLRFPRGGQTQDALCEGNPTLASETLDYDPKTIVGVVPGFQRSKARRGLNLSSDGCDAFHIFWDQSQQVLKWWRN